MMTKHKVNSMLLLLCTVKRRLNAVETVFLQRSMQSQTKLSDLGSMAADSAMCFMYRLLLRASGRLFQPSSAKAAEM